MPFDYPKYDLSLQIPTFSFFSWSIFRQNYAYNGRGTELTKLHTEISISWIYTWSPVRGGCCGQEYILIYLLRYSLWPIDVKIMIPFTKVIQFIWKLSGVRFSCQTLPIFQIIGVSIIAIVNKQKKTPIIWKIELPEFSVLFIRLIQLDSYFLHFHTRCKIELPEFVHRLPCCYDNQRNVNFRNKIKCRCKNL
jgi:hypothetical protein